MFNRKSIYSLFRLGHLLCWYLLVMFLFTSCSDVIEYSPFDTLVRQRESNRKNINKIDATSVDTLVFVFMADSHIFYDELKDAVACINADPSVRFVVVGGDITSLGLAQEYEWYYEIMKKLKVPFVTAIGNHDYLSNGQKVYNKMFGPTNFTFGVGNYLFIVFDDVVWENNNRSPEFSWLSRQLSDTVHFKLLVTHIPPWSDQLEHSYQPVFKQILSDGKPLVALFGHTHAFDSGQYTGVTYAVTGTIEDRTYLKVTLSGNIVNIQKIDY